MWEPMAEPLVAENRPVRRGERSDEGMGPIVQVHGTMGTDHGGAESDTRQGAAEDDETLGPGKRG